MRLDFIKQVNDKRLQALEAISNTPVSALVWGPNPTMNTPVANCRKLLKESLTAEGVYVCFSEDLYDPCIGFSNIAQQLAQAEAFDIIISIPDSPGSIAEIHDFAIIPGLSHKIVTFLDGSWNIGYSNRTLIELQSTISCRVQLYDSTLLPNSVIDESKKIISALKSGFYLLGRR